MFGVIMFLIRRLFSTINGYIPSDPCDIKIQELECKIESLTDKIKGLQYVLHTCKFVNKSGDKVKCDICGTKYVLNEGTINFPYVVRSVLYYDKRH